MTQLSKQIATLVKALNQTLPSICGGPLVRVFMALTLLYALASPAMAARRHEVFVAVDVEDLPFRIRPPARRR